MFKQGQRIRARYFTLVAAPGKQCPRLGLAVGRKASPRAVVRNRIKRIARDVFRHSQLPALDVVMVARADLGDVPRALLRADIEAVLMRLNS